MRVTIFVETNEARVLGVGFKDNPEFNYGVEVDLPPAELVAFAKARDAWTAAQERLDMIHEAQLKRIKGARRRIRKIGGRLRKLRQQRKAMPHPSTLLNGGNHGAVCEGEHHGGGRPRPCLDGARN